MRNLILLIILSLTANLAFGASVWPSGSSLKTLGSLDSILFGKTNQTYITGNINPTVTPADAEIGDMYASSLTGKLYRKTDSGLSTNWEEYADQSALETGIYEASNSQLGTRLFTGGVISCNTEGGTSVDITAATGVHVDYWTDPTSVVTTPIVYAGATNISVTNIATSNVTWFYLNELGVVVQEDTPISDSDLADKIYLGSLVHSGGTCLAANVSNATLQVSNGIASSLANLYLTLGPLNYSGNAITANTGALTFNKTVGSLLIFGVSQKTTPKNKDFFTSPSCSSCSFIYTYKTLTGVNESLASAIDSTNYNNTTTGTLDAMQNGWWTFHRVYLIPTGLAVQYGQTEYKTRADAVLGFGSEIFDKDPNAEGALYLGAWLVAKGDAELSQTNWFSAVATGSSGGSSSITYNTWGITNVTSADSPVSIDTCDRVYSIDASGGAVVLKLPDVPSGTIDCRNTFVMAENTNIATVTTVGGTVLIGGETSQTIGTEGEGFSVMYNSGISEYIITQDSRGLTDLRDRAVKTNETTILDGIIAVWDDTAKLIKSGVATLVDGFIRAYGFFGAYTDPNIYAVQDGKDYDSTDTTFTSVDNTQTAENLRPVVATLESTIGKQLHFDAVVDPESISGAWNKVKIKYGLGGTGSELVECSVWNNGSAISNQYAPKLSGTSSLTQMAEVQFEMPSSPTDLKLVCEQIGSSTENFTIVKVWWDNSQDEVTIPNNSETITYTGYTSNDSNKVKLKTLAVDTGSELLSSDNTGTYTKITVEKSSHVSGYCQIATSTATLTEATLYVERGGSVLYEIAQNPDGDNNGYNLVVPVDHLLQVGDVLYCVGSGAYVDSATRLVFSITATPVGASTGAVGQGETPLSAFGWKTYSLSTSYVTSSTTFSALTMAEVSPYQDKDGNWYAWISVRGTASSATAHNVSFSGLVFDTTSNQPMSVDASTLGAYADEANNYVHFTAESATTTVAFSGIVKLASEPTGAWYDSSNNTMGGPITVLAKNAVKDQVCYIKDVKSSGTAGGTFTSGAWQTRTLNTLEGDTGFIGLASNQFTLEAGAYKIEAESPAFLTGAHKIKLYNISDAADEIIGATAHSSDSANTNNFSTLTGVFEISSSKTFEIQHRCATTRATNGFGYPASFSVNEIYTQVKITKVGDVGFLSIDKNQAYKYAVKSSQTEHKIGVDDITGKDIYEITVYFPSDVTSSNTTYLYVGTGITPHNSINYSGPAWLVQGAVAQGTSDSRSIVYFDKATGYIAASISGYKIGAGTKLIFRYTKD